MHLIVAVRLYTYVLNVYISFFSKGVDEVTASHLTGLIQLIKTNIGEIEDEKVSKALNAFFANSLQHIRSQRDAEGGEQFKEIVIE